MSAATTLSILLDNQVERTRAALEDLPDDVFAAEQPCDCASIRQIGAHLVKLRVFQLKLLEASTEGCPEPAEVDSAAALLGQLDTTAAIVRDAIVAHDESDWTRTPDVPREGPWGELPTLERFARPFNDFTNHLGAIRAIRRQLGAPAERTQ